MFLKISNRNLKSLYLCISNDKCYSRTFFTGSFFKKKENTGKQISYKTLYDFFLSPFKKINIINWIKAHLAIYPTSVSSNYFYSVGSVLGIFFVIQITTGLLLAVYYDPDTGQAWESVQYIFREVNNGWLIKFMHLNGATFIFGLMYVHIGRGVFTRSYAMQRPIVWYTGMLILFLTMATAFLGYVLIWGQMSYWAAIVITNLLSGIPVIGDTVVLWLWGGPVVGGPTLKRIYAFHIILPFIILVLIFCHILALHAVGSSNPIQDDDFDKIRFHPYHYSKDLFVFLIVFFMYMTVVLQYPNYFNHPENFIKANPLVTPPHIVPEWYFLPFYAILRSVPNKELGIILMILSIVSIVILPKIDRWSGVQSQKFRSIHQFIYWCFITDIILLGFCGMSPLVEPYIWLSKVCTGLYFFLYLCLFVFVPFLEVYLAKRITDDRRVLKKKDWWWR